MNKTLIAVMVAIFGIVGAMDYKDQQGAEANYCAMVADGLWPEYRKGEVTCE